MAKKPNYELMSVDYTETDSEWPALVFCSDFIVAITNASFVKSFIVFSETDLIFKLNYLSGNKLSFTVAYEDEDIPENSVIQVFLDKLPMGYASLDSITEAMHYVAAKLKQIKEQKSE